MKNFTIIFVLTFMAAGLIAQDKCCDPSTVAPEVTTGTSAAMLVGNNTVAPTLAVQASLDLPNTEFVVTKRGATVMMDDGAGNMVPDTTGGGGDVIIGSDVDGVFVPATKDRYGITLTSGDTIDVVAVGYDLSVIKVLADSLLNGYAAGSPCCSLFVIMATVLGEPSLAGFCDSVRNEGVYNSSDVNDMNGVLTIFDAFSSAEISIGRLVWTLNTVNGASNFISPDCGGTGNLNLLSYGVNRNAKYAYPMEGSVSVQELSDVSVFMLYPNPAANGTAQIFFTTKQSVDLSINMYNAVGQLVDSKLVQGINGNYNTTINTQSFVPGVYRVELTDGLNNVTKNLVIR